MPAAMHEYIAGITWITIGNGFWARCKGSLRIRYFRLKQVSGFWVGKQTIHNDVFTLSLHGDLWALHILILGSILDLRGHSFLGNSLWSWLCGSSEGKPSKADVQQLLQRGDIDIEVVKGRYVRNSTEVRLLAARIHFALWQFSGTYGLKCIYFLM